MEGSAATAEAVPPPKVVGTDTEQAATQEPNATSVVIKPPAPLLNGISQGNLLISALGVKKPGGCCGGGLHASLKEIFKKKLKE